MELTKISSEQIKISVLSLITGFALGGLILDKAPEMKTLHEAYEVEKEVFIDRVVTVEKIVEKKIFLTADKAKVTEETKPDGTLTITSEYYNLGINSQLAEQSTHQELLQVRVDEKVKSEKALTTSTLSNSLSLHFYSPYASILEFDSTSQWFLQYTRHILSSPFFGSISAGPQQFSLGIGFSF